uniref:Secreted protein n=1 Tax=Physcomitrium patens TaxID=3218 RepID=A0A2K1J8E1_PHYPA|nr:hypothetical protein PHYPA_020886 [Physcomitrium patens]
MVLNSFVLLKQTLTILVKLTLPAFFSPERLVRIKRLFVDGSKLRGDGSTESGLPPFRCVHACRTSRWLLGSIAVLHIADENAWLRYQGRNAVATPICLRVDSPS